MILNMCIDISDVTFPILWIPILLAIPFRVEKGGSRQSLNRVGRMQFQEAGLPTTS
jgi:hypothetical protein